MTKMSVWKFPIKLPEGPPGTKSTLELPAGAKVLTIAEQGLCPASFGPQYYLWALVDTETKKKETRKVLVIGTGHEFPSNVFTEPAPAPSPAYVYQNTVLSMKGRLVFHFWVSKPL